MFAMDDEKLPPPTPAIAATISSDENDTPGCSTKIAAIVGMRSSAALTTVQFRPPNLATANVYGSRMPAPTAVGSVVSRNFCDGSSPYSGPRKSTNTDQRLQIENPMCSEKMENMRFRFATFSPFSAQNTGSSGRQSSIQCA